MQNDEKFVLDPQRFNLDEALQELEVEHIYWLPTCTKKEAHVFEEQIKKFNNSVYLSEVRPVWDYVIYNSDVFGFNEVVKIAEKRAKKRGEI